jgi:hypothetical protein
MKMTSERVDYLYDLMDAAYDAQPIYKVSRTLGHVAIIGFIDLLLPIDGRGPVLAAEFNQF